MENNNEKKLLFDDSGVSQTFWKTFGMNVAAKLRKKGIRNLYGLCSLSENEVSHFNQMGLKGMELIKARLAKFDLRLGMSKEDLHDYMGSSGEMEKTKAASKV